MKGFEPYLRDVLDRIASAGMRDKLIHDYLGVDLEYVWNAAGSFNYDELE